MRVVTKGGDKGQTSLFGGVRVSKDNIRVECYGTFDEANSSLGLLRAKLGTQHSWQQKLYKLQLDIMLMMSHIATPENCPKENTKEHPEDGPAFCEKWMAELESSLPQKSDSFILPGGTEISALCHIARTQFRRAERRLVSLMAAEAVPGYILVYANRLSDLMFFLARADISASGIDEERWKLFVKPPSR
jgi:cob(I)alamin adenosyltransferase